MKTFLFAFALLLVTLAGNTFAQSPSYEHILLNSVRLAEGANTVQLPNGHGTIRFIKRGDTYSNVLLINPAGKMERLTPTDGTESSPKPECKCPMPDACFGTENTGAIMCMCKPCNLTAGYFTISLLLPAIQKVREAAARSK